MWHWFSHYITYIHTYPVSMNYEIFNGTYNILYLSLIINPVALILRFQIIYNSKPSKLTLIYVLTLFSSCSSSPFPYNYPCVCIIIKKFNGQTWKKTWKFRYFKRKEKVPNNSAYGMRKFCVTWKFNVWKKKDKFLSWRRYPVQLGYISYHLIMRAW